MCRSNFNSVRSPLACFLSKGPLKGDFLEICLTTFFGVRNFENTSAMRSIFSLKLFKILSTFQKCRKNWENVFCFWDNCIWRVCLKFSLLRRKFLWWEVSVLRNSLRNLHMTKRDFFQLNCVHSDQEIW